MIEQLVVELLWCIKLKHKRQCVTDHNHLGHVALGAGVLGPILHPHQNQEVKVMPHVVFGFDVLLEGHRLVVEFVPFQPCKTLALLNRSSSKYTVLSCIGFICIG